MSDNPYATPDNLGNKKQVDTRITVGISNPTPPQTQSEPINIPTHEKQDCHDATKGIIVFTAETTKTVEKDNLSVPSSVVTANSTIGVTPSPSTNDTQSESHSTTKPHNHVAPKPSTNNAWYAYVIITSSFCVHMIAIGLPGIYGVFQQEYKMRFPDATSLEIAFIGALGVAGLPIFSIPAGRMTDLYGPRLTCMVGAFITSLSLLIASCIPNSIIGLFIFQGAFFGMGTSVSYIPALTVLQAWFSRQKRATDDGNDRSKYAGVATGVAVAGSGVGGLILAPLVRLMLTSIGWVWTMRVLGIMAGFVLVINAFLLKLPEQQPIIQPESIHASNIAQENAQPQKPKRALDLSYFKDSLFVRIYVMIMFTSFGYFVPFFYVPVYAVYHGMTSTEGATLIGLLNGASGVGRVLLGLIADTTLGPINSFVSCLLMSILSVLMVWPFVTSFGGVLGFAIMYGLCIGGFISLLPTVIARLFASKGPLATLTGMLYNGFLFGNLFGTPIAGLIIDAFTTTSPTSRTINFLPTMMFCAGFLTLSFLMALSIKISVSSSTKFWSKM